MMGRKRTETHASSRSRWERRRERRERVCQLNTARVAAMEAGQEVEVDEGASRQRGGGGRGGGREAVEEDQEEDEEAGRRRPELLDIDLVSPGR